MGEESHEQAKQQDPDPPVRIDIGNEELVINNKYETLSIANDVLIGIFFFVGSILFYFKPLEFWAVTLFVLGSVDFLLRPIIRMRRKVHLKRLGRRDDHGPQYY
ncbi:YrhK family protein [Arthrobacter monumenti]